MSTSNLGTLASTPRSLSDATVTTGDPNDTYIFRTTGTSNINLSLNEISSGDDADLRLYQDSNRNGRLDITRDRLLQESERGSNEDDAINVQAGAGTYFAQVTRFAPGSSGSVTYDLDLSATPTRSASNLLPREFTVDEPDSLTESQESTVGEFDSLSGSQESTVGEFDSLFGSQEFVGSINNNNTADVYAFTLNDGADIGGSVDITLSGLSNDADIRLIQDFNENRIVNAGEVNRVSSAGGSANDSILDINQAGSYYLQVYQFSGNTDYTLNFDYSIT